FFFSSRRRHTRSTRDWSSDVCSSDLPGWAHTDVGQEIRRRLSVPVAFDTDVNAAALGEHRWGACQGLDTFCYITVGTGIGGGGRSEERRVGKECGVGRAGGV